MCSNAQARPATTTHLAGVKATSLVAVAAALMASCSRPGSETAPRDETVSAPMRPPVDSTFRVPADAARDALRHPDLFLDFAELRPGATVLELGAGDGYTTLHVARRVGPSGTTYALNPPQWQGFMAPYLARRFATGRPEGITWIEQPFDDPVPPAASSLDLVLNVLTYHDLLYMNVDRQRMNQRLFDAVAPGGRYLIIDHAARPTEALAVGGTLHRIGRQAVIDEVTAAGFRLIAESDALRMPEDDRTTLAWTTPQPRTDRFILLFERPGPANAHAP